MTELISPSPRFLAVASMAGLFCFFGIAVWGAENMMLVENGRANAVLIVEKDDAKAMLAAEVLRKYLRQMSGADLALFQEGAEPAGGLPPIRIHVGHTVAARGQNVPSGFDPAARPEVFEEEGYVLRTLDPANLLVAGNNDGPYRGTIFAAYALLEKLGCRFYFPGEWGEVIPEQQTVSLPKLDILSRPDFAVRHIWLSGWVRTSREEKQIYDEWGDKIGFSSRQLYPSTWDGSLAYLTPPEEYFEKHPEFFSMGLDGQRRRGKTLRHTMVCLSNEDFFQEAVKNLKRGFAGEIKMPIIQGNGFGISPPDGMPYCYCKDCKAKSVNFQYPHYGYLDRPANSEEYYNFAARLAREFPERLVGTMAYSLREFPPEGVKFEPNMYVRYAPITTDVLHAADTKLWRRRQSMEILRRYREMTPHVVYRDYNPGMLAGMFVPERDAANMAVEIPMLRELKIKGMDREGRKSFMNSWLSYYVTAKLLWDASTDVAALKQDFYNTFFGAAAGPHVQAWWDACESMLGASATQAHEDWLLNHLYTLDFVSSIRPHAAAAMAAAATPAQRGRLQAFALIVENLELFAAMNDAERRLDFAAAAAAAERMEAIKDDLNKIYSFFISPSHNVHRSFANGRAAALRVNAAKRDGSQGNLVADLPLRMRFARDPFNEGMINRWYLPRHPDSDWDSRDTYYLLEQQEEPLNDRGFHYSGYVWYRTEIEVPETFAGQDLRLCFGGIINEAWIWVNGEFAGHRQNRLWWGPGHTAEFNVGKLLRPGSNSIAVRVLNHPDEVGGLYRRGFVYAAAVAPAAATEAATEADGE